MRPIISIVGKANSGKTTLLEKLITELKQRGYSVAIIKHASEDVELDTKGKDSWRFSQAGSDTVAISSPHQLAVFRKIKHDLSPQEISHSFGGEYDIILTEGFKQANTYKIEVHHKDQGKDLVSNPEQLLAVVTDEPLEMDMLQFAQEDVGKITDLIESKVLMHFTEGKW
ncbi:molybdopterin-guanine dinucleotide biosynthesis protein B [Chloroflexota bacterium]